MRRHNSRTSCDDNPLLSRVGREAAGHASEQRELGDTWLSCQAPEV
jgi:hypothetical protein